MSELAPYYLKPSLGVIGAEGIGYAKKSKWTIAKGILVMGEAKPCFIEREDDDLPIHLLNKSETEKSEKIRIKITNNFEIELTNEFDKIAQAIIKSKEILKLKNNWDEEGSVGYKKETLVQAIKFLMLYAECIKNERDIIIDAPKFLPSANGSIDLLWRNPNYDLIINIPSYPNKIAKFYGDDRKHTQINGKFEFNNFNQGIFLSLLFPIDEQIPC